MNLDGETNLKMVFLKCSFAGIAYVVCSTEVELVAAKQKASDIRDQDLRFYKEVSMHVNLSLLGHSCTILCCGGSVENMGHVHDGGLDLYACNMELKISKKVVPNSYPTSVKKKCH